MCNSSLLNYTIWLQPQLKVKILIATDKNIEALKNKIPNFLKKNTKIIKFYKSNNFSNKLYRKSDILINTSIYEGFPNVIAEAINYWCLIITSDSFGGKDDLIKNEKYGFIYKTKNFNELSKKITFAPANVKFLMALAQTLSLGKG